MISKKHAEKIMGKPIEVPPMLHKYSTAQLDWLDDVPILLFEELASEILTEEILFLMHPGWDCSYNLTPDMPGRYVACVKRTRAEIKSVGCKKAILIGANYNCKEQTLRFLHVDRASVILVPTEFNYSILKEDILRMGHKQFYDVLSVYVNLAGVGGEDGCFEGLVKDLENCKPPIKTYTIEGLTYL